jgi:hypothetical protein
MTKRLIILLFLTFPLEAQYLFRASPAPAANYGYNIGTNHLRFDSSFFRYLQTFGTSTFGGNLNMSAYDLFLDSLSGRTGVWDSLGGRNGNLVVRDTVLFRGAVYIGDTTSNTLNAFKANVVWHLTDDSTEVLSVNSLAKFYATDAPFTDQAIALIGRAELLPANTQDFTASLGLVGVEGAIRTDSGATGTISNSSSFLARGEFDGLNTITRWNGFYVQTPSADNGVYPTNIYGLYIGDMDIGSGTDRYAIYAEDGESYLGGNLTVSGSSAPGIRVLGTGATYDSRLDLDGLKSGTNAVGYIRFRNNLSGGIKELARIQVLPFGNDSSGAIQLQTSINGAAVATRFVITNNVGKPRWTFGTTGGTGASGQTYLSDSGYVVTTQLWDASRNLMNLGNLSFGSGKDIGTSAVPVDTIYTEDMSVSGFANFSGTNTGTATFGAGDSIQVTLTGVTSSCIVIATYTSNTALTTSEIPIAVGNRQTNKFTLFGSNGETVAYWVAKK